MPLILPLTVPVFSKSRPPMVWSALAHAFGATSEHSIAVPSRCIPQATFALQKSHSTPSGEIGGRAGYGDCENWPGVWVLDAVSVQCIQSTSQRMAFPWPLRLNLVRLSGASIAALLQFASIEGCAVAAVADDFTILGANTNAANQAGLLTKSDRTRAGEQSTKQGCATKTWHSFKTRIPP